MLLSQVTLPELRNLKKKHKSISKILRESNLCGNSTLLDQHFLPGTLSCCGVKSRRPSRSVWKSMSSHVFTIRLSDDAEGSCVSVRDISYWVSVQCGLMGDWTNLLDRKLRTWLCAGWEACLERFVITERYIGARTQASGGLLGRCGGIWRSSLRNVLIQPLEKIQVLQILSFFHNHFIWWWSV